MEFDSWFLIYSSLYIEANKDNATLEELAIELVKVKDVAHAAFSCPTEKDLVELFKPS